MLDQDEASTVEDSDPGYESVSDPDVSPPQPVVQATVLSGGATNTSVEGHVFSKVYPADHPCRFVRSGQYMIDNPVLSVPSLIGDGVLPEEGSMICGGKIGMGKSMIVMNTLYDCCAGDPVMGLPELEVPRPLRVLY